MLKQKNRWKCKPIGRVSFRWEKPFPKLILHEKFEKKIKWSLRILTIIGISTSILTIEEWYLSLSISLLLFGLEQILEKVIFQYTSLYVQPMPNWEHKSREWKGMCFDVLEENNEEMLNAVGCVFKTEEYGKRFFQLLKCWNYDNKIDKDNNICLSFVIESNQKYSVYLYANPERDSVKDFFKKVEESNKFEKYGKEHQKLIFDRIFRNTFDNKSKFDQFIEKQNSNKPFWLIPSIERDDGAASIIYGEEPILKYHFRVVNRSELSKRDVEFIT